MLLGLLNHRNELFHKQKPCGRLMQANIELGSFINIRRLLDNRFKTPQTKATAIADCFDIFSRNANRRVVAGRY